MPPRIDMTGQVFGRLTVTALSGKTGYKGAAKWECRCACGALTYVERGNLTQGNSTSCGCHRREILVNVRVGDIYERLTVLERLPNFMSAGGKFSYWKCSCSCGNVTQVMGMSLTAGKTKSCGCLRVEAVRKNGLAGLNDLTGQTFGWLTVSRRALTPVCARTRWLCLCRCGTETIVSGTSLISGNTVSCGCARAKVAGESRIRHDAAAMRSRIAGVRRRSIHRQAYCPFDKAALQTRLNELTELAHRLERETGERWDVDHIVPLSGPYSRKLGCRVVCGLHNAHNLQFLRHSENSSKGNRWWPDMW